MLCLTHCRAKGLYTDSGSVLPFWAGNPSVISLAGVISLQWSDNRYRLFSGVLNVSDGCSNWHTGKHPVKFTVWGFGTSAMESMGSFSLISVGAGSCPNSAKQPPTLQNKYREAYGYCQGNRWIFIRFVKELEAACCVLIRRFF